MVAMPFLLSSVCRHWRTVCLGTRHIWRTFSNKLSLYHIILFLQRSRGLPLNLVVDRWYGFPGLFFEVFGATSCRFRYLEVESRYAVKLLRLALQTGPWTSLRVVLLDASMDFPHHSKTLAFVKDLSTNVPLLETLQFDDGLFPWSSSIHLPASLTRLDVLENFCWAPLNRTVNHVLSVLQQVPKLSYLKLGVDVAVVDRFTRSPQVHLPHLKTLDIDSHFEPAMALLENVHFNLDTDLVVAVHTERRNRNLGLVPPHRLVYRRSHDSSSPPITDLEHYPHVQFRWSGVTERRPRMFCITEHLNDDAFTDSFLPALGHQSIWESVHAFKISARDCTADLLHRHTLIQRVSDMTSLEQLEINSRLCDVVPMLFPSDSDAVDGELPWSNRTVFLRLDTLHITDGQFEDASEQAALAHLIAHLPARCGRKIRVLRVEGSGTANLLVRAEAEAVAEEVYIGPSCSLQVKHGRQWEARGVRGGHWRKQWWWD